MDLQAGFPDKRKKQVRKMANYEATDEGSNMTPENLFKMQIYKVFDTLLSQLNWRYDQLRTICNDFSFLYGSSLESTSVFDLNKSAADLAIKYSKDLNMYDFTCEIQSIKFEASTLIHNIKTATPLEILQALHDFGLIESYPNINVALRIFLTIPVSTASCERSFSKLKFIKNYLRSTIGQERISNLSIISIEYNIVKNINYDDVINDFAEMKARKVQFK